MVENEQKKFYEHFVHDHTRVRDVFLRFYVDNTWRTKAERLDRTQEEENILLIAGYLETLSKPEDSVSFVILMMLSTFDANILEQEIEKQSYSASVSLQMEILATVIVGHGGEIMYTHDEFDLALSGKHEQVDLRMLAYTCVQLLDHFDGGMEYVERLVLLLDIQGVREKEEMAWQDALFLGLFLHVIWSYVDTLTEGVQAFLLKNYFVASVVARVPVESRLQRMVEYATDVFEFVTLHNFIADSLMQNVEILSGDMVPQVLFADIVKRFVTDTDITEVDGFRLQQFVSGLYEGKVNRGIYESQLRILLSLALRAHRGTLSKTFLLAEETPYDKMQQDIVSLLVSFFDKQTWSEILSYFQKTEERMLTLGAFLGYCKEIYSLDTDVAMKKFLEFTVFLKDNNLLEESQDIIEYHEEDQKFHWNDEYLEKL
jgi:hypothetical protein